MDHHSWHARPPPIIQGNNTICPTCSISHFPFCPPRPSINENPNRFIQSHNNDYFFPERPQFDYRPYNHHGPTDNFHPNYGFGDRLAWPRNPNTYSYDHSNVGFKRLRADDSGLFTSGNHVNNYSNLVSEDEQRLKLLIRDHGRISGSSPQVNYENNGSMQDNTILKRNFSTIEGEEHGKIDELPSKLNGNVEMYEFQHPNIDYFEKGVSSHPKPGFIPNKYREEKGFGVGQQCMHTNGSEIVELGHSQYGQVENSVLNSSRRDGNISQTVGRFTNIDQAQKIQDGVAPYREGGIQYNSHMTDGYLSVPKMGDKKLPSVGSQSVHYPHSQSPNESFQNQNVKRIHPSDSLSINEANYSHRTNWHGMQGSMNEQRSNFPVVNQNFENQMPHSYIVQHPVQPNHDSRQSFRVNVLSEDDVSSPYGRQNLNKGGYLPMCSGANVCPTQASRLFDTHPPLPASPPPPLPVESPGHPYLKPFASSSPLKTSSSLFPISVSSSMDVPSSYPSVAEAHSLAQTYSTDKPHRHMSTGFSIEGFEARQTLSMKYSGEVHSFPLRQIAPDKPKIVDASQIFKQPHRATRPDHIVIILRGLPGSGKSYLAKILRDLEVENGGDAPRIHSMDDYFMTEVEKVEDSEFSKSSGSIRGKKAVMKKVMEYCYEPEMEEAYRSSMLKAFKKTLDEGVFSFIIENGI